MTIMSTSTSAVKNLVDTITGAASNKTVEDKPTKQSKTVKIEPNAQAYIATSAKIGADLARALKLEADAAVIKKEINVSIKMLHTHKVVVGRKGKCPVATAFFDAMVQGGIAKNTSANYLVTFRDHVKSGKEVTDWNKSRASTSKTEPKKKEPKAFAEVFATAFNFGEGKNFRDLCLEAQNAFEDMQVDSFYAYFQDFLMFQGVKVFDEDGIELSPEDSKE